MRNSEARFLLFDMMVDSSLPKNPWHVMGSSCHLFGGPFRGVTFGGSGVSIGIDSREARRLLSKGRRRG